MKWHYQFSPHDTHDWDAVQPMLLVDEVWEGKPRKLLVHGDRNGMFYVLDRTNGQFLRAHQLASKVTWLKGFTKEGKPIVDPASIASREGAAVCPGLAGGAFTGKKAWDLPGARTGVLSTAGGLVFTSGAGGLLALDAKTDKPIWSLNIVSAGQTAPTTYMVGGKQYVVLAGGGSVIACKLF